MTFTFIAAVAWLIRSIKRGEIEYSKNYAGIPLVALTIFVIISAFFSGARSLSFMGTQGGEVDTAFAIIGFTLFYFLISASFREKADYKNTFIALMASGSIAVLHVILQAFGITLFPWDFAQGGNFNPVGTMNAFGLYVGFIGVLSFAVAYYMSVTKRMRAWSGIIAGASFLITALIGYWALFLAIITSLSLLVFFSIQREDKKAPRRNFLPFGMIVASVCMLVFATGVVNIPVPRMATPAEVAPSISASIKIAASTARSGIKNFLLGSGPATYQYEYAMHHDAGINNTLFWNVQFTQGFNAILTIFVSWGTFGTILFLLFLGVIIHTMVRLSLNRRMDHVTGTVVALGAYAVITLFLYPQNFVLYFLLFAFAGMLAALSAEGNGGYDAVSFSLPIGMMFAVVLITGLLYINGRRYVAGVQFGRGVALATETKDVAQALPLLISGVSLDSQNDAYLGVIASAYLAQANSMAITNEKTPSAEAQKNVADAITSAVAAAERATQVNPLSAANWIALAQLYEAVAPLKPEVASLVLPVYSKAASLDPSNPSIPTYIGSVHAAAEADGLAIASFEVALALKSDYLPALFKLGVLHYQAGRFAKAQELLGRAVAVSPDYANALYFLGLAYDRLGDRTNALAQFERVAQLNPENMEIKGIITNVRAGRYALSSGEKPTPKKK